MRGFACYSKQGRKEGRKDGVVFVNAACMGYGNDL